MLIKCPNNEIGEKLILNISFMLFFEKQLYVSMAYP